MKYEKWIKKHKMNKIVLVYIVSVVFLKIADKKTIGTQIEEEKYYGEIAA